MIIISGKTDFKIEGPSAVAIGKFDGIHRGHRRLLDELLNEKRNGRKAVIFTFDPSPATLFAHKVIPGLSTVDEKRTWFSEAGIDVLVEFPMNAETAATDPEEFIGRYLYEQMGAAFIAAGEDVSFGDGGRGNWQLLKKLEDKYSYTVHLIDKVELDGREISSSCIREEVNKGHMESVSRLLGAPYTVHGTVSHGKALGRTIGIPTLNVIPPEEKLLPPNGVYYSVVRCGEKLFRGMTNIGVKPTVTDEKKMVIETYLYDFSGDLYGRDVSISLLSFKRPEMKFAGLDELKNQMSNDVENGRIYHHKHSTLEQIWQE
jgi:riboflavin kinase/FMN adenylyltransferase